MTTIQAVFSNAIFEAAQHQASDIYIMPKQDGYQVSCYTAGGIVPLDVLTASVGAALIRHIKFEAQMDISEMRRPQLGRWTYQAGDRPLHLRVSSVGDFLNRESVVVRLIVAATDRQIRWVETTPVAELTATLARRQGLVLIAGQMGAGKTTTLHYLAGQVLQNQMILTIEDPVEIVQSEYLQLQVNREAEMDYATLLRLALRHHPDVMIIGEIRDAETAHIVVEAALSGHLILSTVHAMSIAGIWYRLRAFGIPAAILRQVLIGLGYQTMVHDTHGPMADLQVAQGDELATLLQEVRDEEAAVAVENAS